MTPDVIAFIDQKMETNDTTAADLVTRQSSGINLNISMTNVKGIRQKLGWLSSGKKYCQLVREANRTKRSEFAQRCIDEDETFTNAIFTDERTVALENHASLSFHQSWEPPKLKQYPNHPLKFHIWGGISRHGPTKHDISDGLMALEFFANAILKDT